MNKSLAFTGREKEIQRLGALYADRRHVVIVGPAGIGKTALLRQVRQICPFLLCEETSSLRRICDGLERQLGWGHRKMNVIERKNRLLAYARRRGETIALDHVALTPPRVSRFVNHLADCVPVWIACRSTLAAEIGHVWQHLFRFERVELTRLTLNEARALVEAAVDSGNIQPEARDYVPQIYHLSKGMPRILEELLIEMATRKYKMGTAFGMHLLDLDRQIQEFNLGVQRPA
ncbi:MAG: AAA family ATPase [Chthoniobacterales bacterium]